MSDQPTTPASPEDQTPQNTGTPPPETPARVPPPTTEATAPAPEVPAQAPTEAPAPAVAPALEPVTMAAEAPAAETEPKAKPAALSGGYYWGTGRRKSAVARVRIKPGSGKFLIQKREVEAYFFSIRHHIDIVAPLKATQTLGKYDIFVNVGGGGQTGQAGAIVLGVARALMKADPALEGTLRDGNYLTRDARKVERKKYGQRGARRRFQFSKR